MLALEVALFGVLGAAPVFFGSVLPNWMVLPSGILTAAWFFALVALLRFSCASRGSRCPVIVGSASCRGP
jgi:hypothetical protein